ncbi:Putative insecticidal toxin complex [Pseudomonas chlororaphis]|uniref:Insecticidal toxin complex n=1 Tax=Pseudomonas chlororaphis TaxID=587753 RepID=A0A3G7TQ07_9PSED|nr:RHS repeat-associated core domain-containing protein [Pseudomonas chlororaphis]AZE48349.1 Putative insecticidal toxin complex [Pseudomonas chlororaphis]
MNIPDIARICHGTPTFQVMGNRGQMIRSLNYNRTPDAPNVLDEYITRQVVNARGFTVSQIDPRLFHERSEQPNFTYQVSLSGQLLCSDSVDAGRQYLLPDAEGRAYWMQDGRGTRRQFSYDLLGRPVSKVEQAAGQVAHLSERWIYGSRNVSSANNLRGQLLEQQDPAGVQRTAGYSLHGQPLSLARQLLKSIEPINDWSADPLLGSQVHTTHWQYTALGEHQVQVDAQGNAQQSVYDVAGQLSACLLKPSGQTQALALQLVEYTASGQKRRTKQGNGVVTEYVYAPETQRLRQVTSRRPAKNGRPVLLQDLAYEYDPVGNILSVTDHSKDVRYFANQIVAPVSRYGYDALYQLASASGRESAGLQDRGAQLPDWQHFPKDAGQLLNYSETYTYDRSGNLIDLEHIGAARYHRKMVVSTTANRAFPSTQKQPLQASDVPGYFDPCGNLKQLSQGRSSLQWDARNQLQQVTLVQRNEEHDLETYQYGGDGQRVRKQRQRLTSGTRRREEVIYLPGLELRTHYVNDQAEETLAVISVGSVRLLHWDTPPAGMKNDALHYSLDNHLGSSVMELDGQADLITAEEYYPFGGTACWLARSKVEAGYKTVRYSGKERDETGLYYYGYRYYAPWLGRWINPDPAGTVDGLNLYQMVGNNPINYLDPDGRNRISDEFVWSGHMRALEEASKKGNFAVSFRSAGKATLDALARGAAAKGHNILEKTIKKSSIEKAYGVKDAPNMLAAVRSAGIEGYVGQWVNNDTELAGIYLSGENEHDNPIYPIDMKNLESSLASLKSNENWSKIPFTGDYDMHDLITFRGAGRPRTVLTDSKEEQDIIDMMNREVAAVDTNRPFDVKQRNTVRHGPQVNYLSHMVASESKKVADNGGVQGAVARPGEFPVAMLDRGRWTVLENIEQLDSYYSSIGARIKESWKPGGTRNFKGGEYVNLGRAPYRSR